jgi:glycosyltransferase involved in cell wall biosynthesis
MTNGEGPAPEISVVIVSTRRTRLPFALDALGEQSLAAARFEVVVVRDPAAGSATPVTAEGLTVRLLEPPSGRNIAALRNLGWRAARAPVVAFTDDDCRPATGWLDALLASSAPDSLVQGRTEPDPDEAHLAHGLARTQTIEGPSPWLQTCNIAYPRAVLERLGGFDERFAQIGEDADLGARATEAGVEHRFAEDALVWHAVNPRSLGRALRDAVGRDTLPLLVRRHPSLRRALHAGIFARESHGWLALALAGSVVARSRSARFAAWMPYLAAQLDAEMAKRPRRVVHALLSAAPRAIVETAELAAGARSSMRERTLVL